MSQFTVVANTSSHVLYLDIGNIAAIKLFAELINGNSNECTVKRLQTASLEFKERLQLLDKIGERVYKMKQFFNEIPTGQHYLFLPGRVEDQIQIYLYTRQLSLLDKVPLPFSNLERLSSFLYVLGYLVNCIFKIRVFFHIADYLVIAVNDCGMICPSEIFPYFLICKSGQGFKTIHGYLSWIGYII